MKLTFSKDGEYGILSLSGSLENLPTAEVKRGIDLVVEQACRYLIVDLKRVTDLSVSALGLIFASKNRLEEQGTLMAVVGPRSELNRLISKESLEKMVPVCETTERAKIKLRKLAFEQRARRRHRRE